MLTRIAQREGFQIDEATLKFIAKHADNSFRDAAKLLEETTINYPQPTVDDVKKIVGLRDENYDLMRLLEKKNLKKIIEFIEDYDKNYGNFKILIEDLLDKLHLLLLKKNGVETELTEDYNFSLKEITMLIKLLQEAYQNLKFSPIESLPLEIAITEYIESRKGGDQYV
jgi:DNA polymerase-3 subunit gamma/tau